MATISNIFIDQDANFSTTVTIKDSSDTALNLTGYTARAQLRKAHLSSSAISFTVAFASDRTTGQITLTLTSTQTGTLTAGRYVYDVTITTSGGTVTRVVEGTATINPSVSRS
jgi:hypothetical protein